MTDVQLVIDLIVCGAITLVSIVLLILIKKNPRRDEKQLARKECLRAAAELKRVEREQDAGGEKLALGKTLRSLNYARRLAQQIAYEDENSASGSILDNVQAARDAVLALRREGSAAERPARLKEALGYLEKAVQLIDDIEAASRVVNKKR